VRFAAAVLRFQIGTYQGSGFAGGAIHDALAVGGVIDSSLLQTKAMRVDVETAGKFTRGETVANRSDAVDHVLWTGQRYETVGVDPVTPNVKVAVGVRAQAFIDLFIRRIGK
jgi:inosine-uridine nucleoside N-ribohydrolase